VHVKQVEESDANNHSHKLARSNLQMCSTCRRVIATRQWETKEGELMIEELELDVKIVSSRINRIRTATSRNNPSKEQPSNVDMAGEDTCW
jgi:hypothetical protein